MRLIFRISWFIGNPVKIFLRKICFIFLSMVTTTAFKVFVEFVILCGFDLEKEQFYYLIV